MRRQPVNIVAAVIALTGQSALTVLPADLPEFAVASIRPTPPGNENSLTSISPGSFTARNITAVSLIAMAFKVLPFQVTGYARWANREGFEVEAKFAENASSWQRDVPLMVRALLERRFNLRVHADSRQGSVYALVPAQKELKLGKPSACMNSSGGGPNSFRAKGTTLSALCKHLSEVLGREVIDRTGVGGCYDIALTWEGELSAFPNAAGQGGLEDESTERSSTDRPSLATALKETLGLKLQRQKGSVSMIVVDHLEHPSEN